MEIDSQGDTAIHLYIAGTIEATLGAKVNSHTNLCYVIDFHEVQQRDTSIRGLHCVEYVDPSEYPRLTAYHILRISHNQLIAGELLRLGSILYDIGTKNSSKRQVHLFDDVTMIDPFLSASHALHAIGVDNTAL